MYYTLFYISVPFPDHTTETLNNLNTGYIFSPKFPNLERTPCKLSVTKRIVSESSWD